MKLLDLKGQYFGSLRVIRRSKNSSHGHPLWVCKCICGAVCIVSGCNLRSGNSTRCVGCKAARTRQQRMLRPYEALYRLLRRQTERAVELTYQQFVELTQHSECHYCGAGLRWAIFDVVRNGSAYNLDRKDNTLGYTADNTVPCCKRCNLGKGDRFTYDEWLQVGSLIRGWKK